jgi:glycosyltransferase involved in cell wall biosynthesis
MLITDLAQKNVYAGSRQSICVIVLTHNAYRDKAGCVEHVLLYVLNQLRPEDSLVVVDNGSQKTDQDRLEEFLTKHAPWARHIVTNTTISKARNCGAALAFEAKTLVFLDDDCLLVQKNSLDRVSQLATINSHGYGARRDWTPDGDWFYQHAEELLAEATAGSAKTLIHYAGPPSPKIRNKTVTGPLQRSFIGHFGFVQRSLFERSGGFPSDFLGYGCEDDAFEFSCYMRDQHFASLADIVVIHVNHHLTAGWERQAAQNHKKYRDLLKHHGVRAFHASSLLDSERAKTYPVIQWLNKV